VTTAPTVPIESMRDKLLDLDTIRERLSRTEPIRAEYFCIGDAIRFSADSTATHGIQAKSPEDPLPVYVTLGVGNFTRRIQLTRQTLEDVAAVCDLKRSYARDVPAELLVPHLNYWFREGLFSKRGKNDFQFIVNDDKQALAFAKASMTPFSNLSLLDCAVEQIRNRVGSTAEILVDYKLSHSLRQTTLRLIVPSAAQVLTDTGTPQDAWSLGVQLKNSLTGCTQTSFDGYLFRWVCTNGQIDQRASSGSYTRRKDATRDEVYAWARQSVDDVLGGLEGALDAVQALTQVGIDGNLADTLRDVFEHYRISLQHRPRIIRYLESYHGEITMYVIMNAITQVANDMSLEASTVDSLLRVGGDLPYTAENRCGACHRMLHKH
jgi:hypothetical protein